MRTQSSLQIKELGGKKLLSSACSNRSQVLQSAVFILPSPVLFSSLGFVYSAAPVAPIKTEIKGLVYNERLYSRSTFQYENGRPTG